MHSDVSHNNPFFTRIHKPLPVHLGQEGGGETGGPVTTKNPIHIPIGVHGNCPTGYHWDASLKVCVQNTTDNHDCPKGSHWDATTKKCVVDSSGGGGGGGGGTTDPLDTLLEELLGMLPGMFSTGGSNGTTAPATPTDYQYPSDNGSGAPAQGGGNGTVALLLIAAGAGLGIWWWVKHHKKEHGSQEGGEE